MVEERHVVDGDDRGHTGPLRHRVVGRVVDVNAELRHDPRQRDLLPHKTQGSDGRCPLDDARCADRPPPGAVAAAGDDRDVDVVTARQRRRQLEHVASRTHGTGRDGGGVERDTDASTHWLRTSFQSSTWRPAAAAHVSSDERSTPAVTSWERTPSWPATWTRASAMASVSRGSTSKAAPPVLGMGLATTGAQAYMASTAGSPKPSSNGTYATSRARPYNPASTGPVTMPARTTPASGASSSAQPDGPTTTSGHGSGNRGRAAR